MHFLPMGHFLQVLLPPQSTSATPQQQQQQQQQHTMGVSQRCGQYYAGVPNGHTLHVCTVR
jgi:hypothetical protein